MVDPAKWPPFFESSRTFISSILSNSKRAFGSMSTRSLKLEIHFLAEPPFEASRWNGTAYQKTPGWWFQPLWKICSSKWVHLPQIGMKIKNIWNHHQDTGWPQWDTQKTNHIWFCWNQPDNSNYSRYLWVFSSPRIPRLNTRNVTMVVHVR